MEASPRRAAAPSTVSPDDEFALAELVAEFVAEFVAVFVAEVVAVLAAELAEELVVAAAAPVAVVVSLEACADAVDSDDVRGTPPCAAGRDSSPRREVGSAPARPPEACAENGPEHSLPAWSNDDCTPPWRCTLEMRHRSQTRKGTLGFTRATMRRDEEQLAHTICPQLRQWWRRRKRVKSSPQSRHAVVSLSGTQRGGNCRDVVGSTWRGHCCSAARWGEGGDSSSRVVREV